MTVHAGSEVADDVVLGDGTTVWPLAQIREGAKLGAGCIVGRGAYVGSGVVMGDNCKLQNYALVYEPAVLEDGVFVGPAVVFTNDYYPRAITPDDKLKRGADRRYLPSRRVITYQFGDLEGWASCASSARGRLGITRYQERWDRSRRRHGGGSPRQVLPARAVTDFDLASATEVAPQCVVDLVPECQDGDEVDGRHRVRRRLLAGVRRQSQRADQRGRFQGTAGLWT